MTLRGGAIEMRIKARLLVPLLAVSAFAAVLLGSAVLMPKANSASAGPSIYSNGRIDLPPFHMIRQVIANGSVSTFDFQWNSETSWKDTLIASNALHADIGQSQELSGGKLITHFLQHEHVSSVDPGIQVPGPWFTDEDWVVARAEQGKAAGVTSYTLSQQPQQTVLTITSPTGSTQWTFDKATGIPVDYKEVVGGNTVVEHRATSVTLANGQVVR